MVNILIPDLITIVGAELVDAGAGEVPERSALIQDSSANYSKEQRSYSQRERGNKGEK